MKKVLEVTKKMVRILSLGDKIRLLFTPDCIMEEIRHNRIRIRKLEKQITEKGR